MFLWRLKLRRFTNILSSKAVAFVVAIFLVLMFGSIILLNFYLDESSPLTSKKTFYFAKGTSSDKIIKALANDGVIANSSLFRIAHYILRFDAIFQAGEYVFPPKITPRSVLNKLINGDIYYRKITIPEGLTLIEILDIIKNTDGLSGDVPKGLREGDLFPDTYYFSYSNSREFLISRMQKKQKEVFANLWQNRGKYRGDIRTKWQALVLASIIEKETSLKDEKSRIAAVFINRLKAGMRLQSDSTVIYAITGGRSKLGRKLTRSDLKFSSPYNTYNSEGLPPGPISSPSAESLEAAMNPQKTKELYFVANGNGGHFFASTLPEHNRNVRKYRKVIQNSKSMR